MPKKLDQVTDIPPQQIKAMQHYGMELRLKHPTWTPEMVGKGIAQKFNINVKFNRNRKANTR
jgi:hypothetical protein